MLAQAIPTYAMACFNLTKSLCDEISQFICRHWWNQQPDERKMHWVGWEKMKLSKEEGGLGFRDLYSFNISLLARQACRLIQSPDSLCARVLKAKYFPSSSPMLALPHGGSQFWKSLVKVRPVFQSFVKFGVGDGSSIRFWLDWWCGDSPLSVTFPTLFSYCPDSDISTMELAANGWDLDFRRSLSPEEFEDWQRLTACFPLLSEEDDSGLTPPLVTFLSSLRTPNLFLAPIQ